MPSTADLVPTRTTREPGVERRADAAVAAAAHDVLVPGLRELSAYAVPACINAGVASVEADYVAALAAVRDGPAKARGVALGKAAAAAIRDLRADGPPDGAAGPGLHVPRGHRSRRVPLHSRYPVRVRPEARRGPAVRAQRRLSVPSRAASRGDRQALHRGLQRGQASGRRRRHHAQRAHRRPDANRAVLGRELPAAVEPDRPDGLRSTPGSTCGRTRACSRCSTWP